MRKQNDPYIEKHLRLLYLRGNLESEMTWITRGVRIAPKHLLG